MVTDTVKSAGEHVKKKKYLVFNIILKFYNNVVFNVFYFIKYNNIYVYYTSRMVKSI